MSYLTAYAIQCIDSDEPADWLDLCTNVGVQSQDSGRVLFHVLTDEPAELELLLADDDSVLEYHVRA